MSKIQEAIDWFLHRKDMGLSDKCQGAENTALEALNDQAEREKGCEYCNGEKADYQHSVNTKLQINTFGNARTIVTECNGCPPYAECSMKNIPARSAFIINFCPNCGRDLRKPVSK